MSQQTVTRPDPVPFALGHSRPLLHLLDQLKGVPILKFAAPMTTRTPIQHQHDHGARFARLLNLGNALAYGADMGMPEWVMLDCGLLPSAFIGFCRRGRELTPTVRENFNARLLHFENHMGSQRRHTEHLLDVLNGPIQDDEWVPIASFCAIPTLIPGEIMGYSLFSLEPGLGVRAKALGLSVHAVLGAHTQLGVAQYSNLTALKSHLRFGPLELIDPLTPLHTKAGETFIYRLNIPSQNILIEMASGTRLCAPLHKTQHTAHSHTSKLHQQSNSNTQQTQRQWIESHQIDRWVELRNLVLLGRTIAELIDARLEKGRPSLCVRLTSPNPKATGV